MPVCSDRRRKRDIISSRRRREINLKVCSEGSLRKGVKHISMVYYIVE
jgi:hypothetical protein